MSSSFPRRKFLSVSAAGAAGLALATNAACANTAKTETKGQTGKELIEPLKPIVVSTWYHGLPANQAAWEILSKDGLAVDAVEKGVMVPEADPKSQSVGYGGLPDREGRVTLDACIMDAAGNCGGVAFVQGIKHPIALARKVMDDTPHVLLVGKGAEQYARGIGFQSENLLTEASEKAWREWLREARYHPEVNVENHDTIGMVALDAQGQLAGSCTTSGLAYKMHGRVGDSPIIGAGLYVDGEVGAATATGLGELVMKTCGTFLIVELMRQGASPQEACEEGVRRIASRQDIEDKQVGFLALDKAGRVGAYSIHPGFDYAITHADRHEMVPSKSMKE